MEKVKHNVQNKRKNRNTIQERAEIARLSLLPEKSKKRYDSAYSVFLKWQVENDAIDDFSQDCLLTYFQEFVEKYAPSTW